MLQQVFHLLLIFSFLTQGATGLARMYIETSWGRTLAWIFGGYESCRTIHIYVGIIMMCGFALHCLYLLFRINWRKFPGSLFGPDSLLPRFKDIKDFFQHIGWFLGIAKPPEFDRWGYWEKFDYWAVFWGLPLLAVTGVMLRFPVWTAKLLPGWILNIAALLHRAEAILAASFICVR